MRSISSILAGTQQRVPVSEWSLERIMRLPHTATARAQLAEALAHRDDPGGIERIRLMQTVLEEAIERDAAIVTRPTECWCYGHGGKDSRALMLPGDDVPMVLGIYCDCPDGQVRRDADQLLREKARTYAQEVRLMGIWEGAKIPERFNGCSFETYPASPQTALVVASLRGWLDTPGWVIVLLGEFGVGKTGLAISALREAAQRRLAGLFIKTPDLLARIRATYGKGEDVSESDVLTSLRTVDYLVLDDIGAEKQTDWATSMLFQILDHRHDQQRKTILTTNLDVTGLGLHMGERTMHRFEEGALFLTVDGPNLRKAKP